MKLSLVCQNILLDDDTLDGLKLETRHTPELAQFDDACSIDPLHFDRSSYVLPDGDVAEEGIGYCSSV